MLLNLSNHHSSLWHKNQLNAAMDKYESIVDIKFPYIDPEFDEHKIEELTQEYFYKCKPFFNNVDRYNAVHIMGEHNFVFNIVSKFLRAGINCVASTTNRKSSVTDNLKTSEFSFVKFREYTL